MNQSVRERIDVAVVGGGISGAYCCWRLQAAGRVPVLFEMSNRIGGRLFSVEVPGMPNVIGELGGMRFLRSQEIVLNLVNHLQLSISDFPTGGPQNIAALRGVLLANEDFKNSNRVPYRLLPGERGLDPGALLIKAIKTIIPDATSLTPQQWEETKRTAMWNGNYLYNWGLWNALLSTSEIASRKQPVLSSEAYALLYDGGGYQSLVDNWNCAEAFEYLLVDFPSSAQYLRLTKGFQMLPETLAQRFKDVDGRINMHHRLLGFAQSGDNGNLAMDLDVWDEQNKVMHYYRAKALILAMPQYSLQKLARTTPMLGRPDVGQLLKSVMPMPAHKTLVAYEAPWWQKLGLFAGRSTTDLPIRQVYYMDLAAPPNTNSLMLATYADGRTESFWNAIPNDLFINTLQALIAEMHQVPLDEIPEPYFVRAKDWIADPYGAGWHFWRAGIKVWETLPQVRQPIPQTPMYICGEAYGNQQGWVEGALTSAEHVLQDHFGLSRPAWLPSDYYIGP